MNTDKKRLPVMEDLQNIHYTGPARYNTLTGKAAWTDTFANTGENISCHWITRIHTCPVSNPESLRTITAGGLLETNPCPANDGSTYFLSDKTGYSQLYRMQQDHCTQLTDLPFGILDYGLSPDEKRIWLSAWDAPCSDHKSAPIVFEEHPFKSDADLGFKQQRKPALWLYDCCSKDSICLLDSRTGFLHPVWHPDSSAVLYQLKNDHGTLDIMELRKDDLWKPRCIVSMTNVSPASSNKSSMLFTPDGSHLILIGKPPRSEYAEPERLYMVPVNDKKSTAAEAVELINPLKNETGVTVDNMFLYQDDHLQTFQILPDGTIIFLSAENGSVLVWQAAILPDGHAVPKKLTAAPDNFEALTYIGDHKVLALHTSWRSLPETVLLDLNTGGFNRFTVHNQWAEEIAWQPASIHWFQTPGAPKATQGFYLPPANVRPDQKYPAILYCHGGPTGFYSTSLYPEQQALAAAGFAVIYANPRGSTGYGTDYSADEDAYNGNAALDLENFVHKICETYPYIDPDRLGVCGGSYGGYMTTYLSSHSTLFKAASTHRPLLNWQMIGYASHSAGCMHTRSAFPDFRDYLKECLDISPTTCAEDIHIPFQIQQSLHDANCIPEQVFQLFTAIRNFNPDVPCRMILYPVSGHSLLSRGPVSVALQHRKDNLEWFKRWL